MLEKGPSRVTVLGELGAEPLGAGHMATNDRFSFYIQIGPQKNGRLFGVPHEGFRQKSRNFVWYSERLCVVFLMDEISRTKSATGGQQANRPFFARLWLTLY